MRLVLGQGQEIALLVDRLAALGFDFHRAVENPGVRRKVVAVGVVEFAGRPFHQHDLREALRRQVGPGRLFAEFAVHRFFSASPYSRHINRR